MRHGQRREETIAAVFDNLRRVVQMIQGYSKRARRIGGLTGPQLRAIRVMADSTSIRVTDLARHMYLHPSTVVGILDRLESKGLAARRRSMEDHRVVEVRLTAKGKAVVTKSPAVAQGLLLDGLEALSENDLGVVSEGLELLVAVLRARRVPPQLLFSSERNVPHRNAPVRQEGANRNHGG